MLKPVDYVIVTDLLGQVIHEISNPADTELYISASNWNTGLYIIQFFRDNKAVTHRKIIKQ